MKIQTSALIKQLIIDGKSFNLAGQQTIDLEFSAIDTGGGFKDPILDFSFLIDESKIAELNDGKNHEITLKLSDPQKDYNETSFSFKGTFKPGGEQNVQANGRLKEDQLSKDLISFVIKRLR
jgi:hypothetical protein